jgi:hypothetical protein
VEGGAPVPVKTDVSAMNAALDDMLAEEAILAASQARLIRLRAGWADAALTEAERIPSRASRDREMPMRSASAEIAAAAHQHDLTVQRELNEAWSLVHRFAASVDALESGLVSRRHVAVIRDAGLNIDDDAVRGAWESVVLDYAAKTTPGRTKAFAIELAERVNPTTMTERFEKANADRGVSIIELDDGMALLQVRLPATLAFAVRDRLQRQTKVVRDEANAERARRAARARAAASGTRAAGDPDAPDAGADDPETLTGSDAGTGDDEVLIDDTRTSAQIQADILTDLLLTGTPAIDPTGDRSPGGLGAIRAHVQVVVPVTTLTGTTDGGALLNGRSPIDAETARRLAGDAPGWDRVMCHPVTGAVLATDRYTPTADQVRFLRARDQHCRAFGCRQPAIRCQIDHNDEWHEGGRTRCDNLCHLCVRHHTLKTETEWTVRQLADGTIEFTSPLGRIYRDEPPPRVMFMPSNDPPPF